MLSRVKPSISHVYAFVGMNGTAEELGLRGSNMWALSVKGKTGTDAYAFTGAALDRSDAETFVSGGSNPWADVDKPEDMLMYLSFPSVKDPSFAERHPGKSTCEIISTAHPEWFERFLVKHEEGGKKWRKNPNRSGKRTDEEYAAIKEHLKEYLVNGLHRLFPKTKGKVDYLSIGTPLTNMYYLNRSDSYGLEHTPAHYAGALDNMRPETAIPGLFATGQDIGTVGIVGALNGGILTAHAILGYGFLDLVVAKRNLIEDIMAMDEEGKKGN